MQIPISWPPCWASWDLRCFNLEIISYEKELWVKKCISFNMELLVSSQNPVKKWSWQMALTLEVSEKESGTELNVASVMCPQNFGDVRMLICGFWLGTCIRIWIEVSKWHVFTFQCHMLSVCIFTVLVGVSCYLHKPEVMNTGLNQKENIFLSHTEVPGESGGSPQDSFQEPRFHWFCRHPLEWFSH